MENFTKAEIAASNRERSADLAEAREHLRVLNEAANQLIDRMGKGGALEADWRSLQKTAQQALYGLIRKGVLPREAL